TPVRSFCKPVDPEGRNEDCWWLGRVRDLSAGGIGLVLRRPFEPGVTLTIELEGSGEGPPPLLVARVVHLEAGAGGGWVIGCAFANPLSDKDLHVLWARLGWEVEENRPWGFDQGKGEC